MALQWQLLILSFVLLLELSHCSIIPSDVDYFYNDNDVATIVPTNKEKRSWFTNFEHNLGKYKNFYAYLLQEENQEYAVELQELYNTVSNALVEPDIRKKEKMLTYTKWLLETTKDLDLFLTAKGIKNI